MTYGVVDIYANFDMPPTQARYYQRAAALYEGVTISIPFDAIGSGVGSVYLGVFGREQGSSSYNISVVELRFENATGPCEVDKTCQRAPTLVNGTWLEGVSNAQSDDGYRFFRSGSLDRSGRRGERGRGAGRRTLGRIRRAGVTTGRRSGCRRGWNGMTTARTLMFTRR
jgi:hypothetical protein